MQVNIIINLPSGKAQMTVQARMTHTNRVILDTIIHVFTSEINKERCNSFCTEHCCQESVFWRWGTCTSSKKIQL